MLITSIFVCLLGQIGATGSDDREALSALAGLYDENRSKFDKGRIWFDFIDAYATSVDEAAKGIVSVAHRADGFYAFQRK